MAAYGSFLEVDIVDEFIQLHQLLKTELGNQYESGDCIERATSLQMHKLITNTIIFCQFFQTAYLLVSNGH